MPKIWEHRDPSTFIETEGLSGLGDEMVHSATITPSTTVAPSLFPDLSSGPVVIVQRPPKPKPDATSVAQQVASYEFSFVMNALCPWSSQVTAKYNALMNNPNLNASSKQVLGNRARQCLASAAKPSVTAPVTRPLTGPSATIAAALARAQAQAALAAAAAAAGKATTQAISKLKTSNVSVSTAPAGGVSAAAKELAAKNQALRDEMAKGATKSWMEKVEQIGAKVEKEISETWKPQNPVVNTALAKIGQKPVNSLEMAVVNRVNKEFESAAGFTPLTPKESAKVVKTWRESSFTEAEENLKRAVKEIAGARVLRFTDAAISGKNFMEWLKSGTVPDSTAREYGIQIGSAAKKIREGIFDWMGLNAPAPKNVWEEMQQNLHTANRTQLIANAGDMSPDFLANQIIARIPALKDTINGPVKLSAKELIKNAVNDLSVALRNPGLRGTACEVLNTQAEETDRMNAGKSLKEAWKNFLMPAIEKGVQTQVKDAIDMAVSGTPKDVFEMQRQRADSLAKMDQLQKQIKAADRGWGEDATLDIAALKSQYRSEKKNVDALGVRIEQVTANPQLSKYAYVQGLVQSQMR
jgi:hypothetical protein